MAGLVLGYNPWDIGMQTHQIAVEPLLDKIGVEYDESKKYEGTGGKPLPEPEFPMNIRCC